MFGVDSKLKLILKVNLGKLLKSDLVCRFVATDELNVLKAKAKKISEVASRVSYLVRASYKSTFLPSY